MLAREDVDRVSICLPHNLHAEENKVKLMIVESVRFSAETRLPKEYLRAGYIRNPILLRKTFMPRQGEMN